MSRSGIAPIVAAVAAAAVLLVVFGRPFDDGIRTTGSQTVSTVNPSASTTRSPPASPSRGTTAEW